MKIKPFRMLFRNALNSVKSCLGLQCRIPGSGGALREGRIRNGGSSLRAFGDAG